MQFNLCNVLISFFIFAGEFTVWNC